MTRDTNPEAMGSPSLPGNHQKYTHATLCVLGALGEDRVESLQQTLDAVDPSRAVEVPDLIDGTIRSHQRYEHLRHRREIMRGLGYASLGEAYPAIAEAYAGLGGTSARLKAKVAGGEVSIIGLLRGPKTSAMRRPYPG